MKKNMLLKAEMAYPLLASFILILNAIFYISADLSFADMSLSASVERFFFWLDID